MNAHACGLASLALSLCIGNASQPDVQPRPALLQPVTVRCCCSATAAPRLLLRAGAVEVAAEVSPTVEDACAIFGRPHEHPVQVPGGGVGCGGCGGCGGAVRCGVPRTAALACVLTGTLHVPLLVELFAQGGANLGANRGGCRGGDWRCTGALLVLQLRAMPLACMLACFL